LLNLQGIHGDNAHEYDDNGSDMTHKTGIRNIDNRTWRVANRSCGKRPKRTHLFTPQKRRSLSLERDEEESRLKQSKVTATSEDHHQPKDHDAGKVERTSEEAAHDEKKDDADDDDSTSP
jgi:adenine-specific DNA methylase